MRECDVHDTAALVAVQRLQAAYADAVSRRAWDEVRALFEPDAEVHITTHSREPFTLTGPGGVVGFVAQALEPFAFFEMAILNAVVDVDGDHASGRMWICEMRLDRAGAWSEAYGLYRDRYRRRDGSWRIAGRHYSSLARRSPEGTQSFPRPPDDPS